MDILRKPFISTGSCSSDPACLAIDIHSPVQRSGDHITWAPTEDINTVAPAFVPGLDGESTTVDWDSHAASGFGTFLVTTPAQVQAANPPDGYGTFLDNAGLLTDDIEFVAPAFPRALDGESTTATVGCDSHAVSGSGDRTHATMPAGTFFTTPIPAQAATYQPLPLAGFCQGHSTCPNCHADPGVGQWRFGEVSQQMVCSACGLYERRKGTRRPLELETRKMLRLLGGGRR
ncbi:hypothetical protein C8F01DRAFT_1345835 [Mycena amicta]|nr:hypothetical protein C8F01DRAFT_1345835 [Mycena amicta]